MYDPAVMGNKSPLVKDDFFFFFLFPHLKMLPLAFCCVVSI